MSPKMAVHVGCQVRMLVMPVVVREVLEQSRKCDSWIARRGSAILCGYRSLRLKTLSRQYGQSLPRCLVCTQVLVSCITTAISSQISHSVRQGWCYFESARRSLQVVTSSIILVLSNASQKVLLTAAGAAKHTLSQIDSYIPLHPCP